MQYTKNRADSGGPRDAVQIRLSAYVIYIKTPGCLRATGAAHNQTHFKKQGKRMQWNIVSCSSSLSYLALLKFTEFTCCQWE